MVFEIFIEIYRKVKDSFNIMKKVYLKNVAPDLVSFRNYLSSIPGLYTTRLSKIKISGFSN